MFMLCYCAANYWLKRLNGINPVKNALVTSRRGKKYPTLWVCATTNWIKRLNGINHVKNVLSIISIIGLKLKLVTNNFMSPKQNLHQFFLITTQWFWLVTLMIINSFSLSVCSSVRITLVNLGIWGEGSTVCLFVCCFND